MAPTVLGYWDIRGLAQPIRLLLAHTESDWEDKLYACGSAPDFSREEWLKEKFSFGFDFPNLPYLIDGNVKITQSNAVLRYLARKNNLLGKTEEERIRVDILESEINDLRREFVGMCYSPSFEQRKDPYLERLPAKLRLLSDFLGSRNFFAGDEITFPDFIVYEMLDQHKHLQPSCLNDFPTLQSFTERIEKQKGIQDFLSSSKCIKFPLNGPMACWGGAKISK